MTNIIKKSMILTLAIVFTFLVFKVSRFVQDDIDLIVSRKSLGLKMIPHTLREMRVVKACFATYVNIDKERRKLCDQFSHINHLACMTATAPDELNNRQMGGVPDPEKVQVFL